MFYIIHLKVPMYYLCNTKLKIKWRPRVWQTKFGTRLRKKKANQENIWVHTFFLYTPACSKVSKFPRNDCQNYDGNVWSVPKSEKKNSLRGVKLHNYKSFGIYEWWNLKQEHIFVSNKKVLEKVYYSK